MSLDPVVSERLAATLALASQGTAEKCYPFVVCRVERETGRYVVMRTVQARTLAEAALLVGPVSPEVFVTSRAALETMRELPRRSA